MAASMLIEQLIDLRKVRIEKFLQSDFSHLYRLQSSTLQEKWLFGSLAFWRLSKSAECHGFYLRCHTTMISLMIINIINYDVICNVHDIEYYH